MPFYRQTEVLKSPSVALVHFSCRSKRAVKNTARNGLEISKWLEIYTSSWYPNSPIPILARIEAIKPVRIAMLRSILGNVPAQTALDSACDIMHELVRKCDPDRWESDERCTNPLDGQQGCEVQILRDVGGWDHFEFNQ
eukprot:Skav227991  [mRNA]  locus=scaffold390:98479:106327:- [translate_table: standard]